MTREEAIAILEVSKHMATSGRMYNEAIDMAIEALSADRPTAEWILDGGTPICSVCHEEPCWSGEGYAFTDYCPNCGADMRGEEDANGE